MDPEEGLGGAIDSKTDAKTMNTRLEAKVENPYKNLSQIY